MTDKQPYSVLLRAIAVFLTALLFAPRLRGQCGFEWLSSGGLPGTNGSGYCTLGWDPDGSGPAAEVAVVGGDFTLAGTVPAQSIAAFDPGAGTWSALGAGFAGATVRCLCLRPNGDLIAGGTFGVARWNGVQWSHFGSIGAVAALAMHPSGALVAAGSNNHIAVFDFTTSTWSSPGGGVPHPAYAVAVRPNGEIVVAVREIFSAVEHVHRWNGVAWSLLGTVGGGNLMTLSTLLNGDVLAVGGFTSIGGVPLQHLARWNGTTWSVYTQSPIAGGYPIAAVLPNGDVVFGGLTLTYAPFLMRFNGSMWSTFGTGLNWGPKSLAGLQNGDVIAAGGGITSAGGVPVMNVARWNGSAWSAMGAGFNASVEAMARMPNGDLLVGGNFTSAGSAAANGVARWNGVAWSAFGNGPGPGTQALLALANGDVIAAGYLPGGIWRWNGSAWSWMGANGPVHALARLPNGDLVAGGEFTLIGGTLANHIARWNGTTWIGLGSGADLDVHDLAVLANGDLVASGDFAHVGGVSANQIARWNGTVWSPLGSGIVGNGPEALLVRPNGDLIVGGNFFLAGGTLANNIARWNGSAWSPVGNGLSGSVSALANLPNGDFAVGGYFVGVGGTGVNYLAKWNGSTWSGFGANPNLPVSALLTMANDEVAVGGGFTAVGSQGSTYLARVASQCPATSVGYGSGCNSSGGSLALTVDVRPWIGSSFRATATGLPTNSLAVGVGGLQPASVPLPSVLPQGVAGCELLATTEALYLLVPAGGTAHVEIPIPAAVPYIGKAFYCQVVALEFDASSLLLTATSTNGQELVIGAY